MNHEFSHISLTQVDQVKIKRNVIKAIAFVLTVVFAFYTLKRVIFFLWEGFLLFLLL